MEVYKKDLSSAHSKKFIELLNSETAKNKIEEGSIVNAEITNITEKFCWVYLGMKSEAMKISRLKQQASKNNSLTIYTTKSPKALQRNLKNMGISNKVTLFS